jgi:AcrR family transcriptional regulator
VSRRPTPNGETGEQRAKPRGKPGGGSGWTPARRGSADDILQTAADLFLQRGYEGTSLAAIGERLGMTAAAIYYHFRSKEDVLFTYLERAMRELITRSQMMVDAASNPEERLRAFTVTYVMFQLEPLERLPVGTSTPYGFSQLIDGLGPANSRKMLKLFWQYVDSLRGIIRDGIEQGVFRPVDVTASAFAVIGMVEHAGMWFRRGSELDVGDVAALYGSHAVHALRTPETG